MCSTCSIYCLLDEDFNKENYSLVKDDNLRFLTTQHKYKEEYSTHFYEKGYKKNGLLDGKGLRKYLTGKKKGTVLKGNFKDGYLISGKIIDNMNFIKIGKFNNLKLYGPDCTKIYPDGTKHIGDFKDDFLNGSGKTISNGYINEGKFINGRLNGKGTKQYEDGRFDKGVFESGYLVKGTRIYTNNIKLYGSFNPDDNSFYEGTKYTLKTVEKGSFCNNHLHGYGEMKNLDGNILKGFFENGKLITCSNKNNANYLNQHFTKNIYDIKKIHILAKNLGWNLISNSTHCKYIKTNTKLVLACTPKRPVLEYFKLRKAEIEFNK